MPFSETLEDDDDDAMELLLRNAIVSSEGQEAR